MAYPSICPSAVKRTGENIALSSKRENGTVVTRPRFSRQRLTFSIDYPPLSATDAASLENFYASVNMFGIFDFTDPDTGTVYQARFVKPVSIQRIASMNGYYSVETVELEEA
jgi:hypothetical protein